MADQILLGLFQNITPTADAIDGVRELGVDEKNITVLSNVPYAPKFFGRKAPRQWWLVFVLGGAITGALLGLFVAAVTPELYPIEVGGQGPTPIPPSAIIVFELTAMFSMIAAFVGFLLQNRFPVLRPQIYDERITQGYIGLEVHVEESLADQVEQVLKDNHATDVKRGDEAEYPSPGRRHLLFWGGAGTVGLVLMAAPLLLTYDIIRIPWFDAMEESPAVGFQEGPRRAVPPESVPIQGPVLLNGQPASEQLESEESIERGAVLYQINCAMCHGQPDGETGPLAKYFQGGDGVPPLPHITEIQGVYPADYTFTVITNGVRRMPSIAENVSPGETWDIVNYIKDLESSPPDGQ
ncbi:MAG: DUF3341 domain-containing protein [Chloroflexi bacterium]|nr:DUF3341 domain-containing protein [Chloroflexota bacterium]